MNAPTNTRWRARLIFAGIAGALAIGTIAALPSPALARVWVSVGGPCCGWYGPGAYYGYGYYPPPYYGAPPAAYYAPPYSAPAAPGPAPSGYAPQSAYPTPGAPATPGPAPSAYMPQSAYPTPGSASATPGTAAAITYTSKPAFTNASGQTCREYKTDAPGGQPVYGTACRMADGQWRVAN